MPLDAQGNFYPAFPGMPPFVTTCSGKICSGDGAPDNEFGTDGNAYINNLTGDYYLKIAGVWTLLQGAPGGSGEAGVGSPEGVVVAPPGTTYTQTDNGAFWAKFSGAGDTGWLQLIA